MLKFLKSSQLRLLISGSLFTGAFIWMAVTAYDVDEAEIQVFLVMSLILIGSLIAAGSVLALLIFAVRKTRRTDGLLGRIEEIERETATEAAAQQRDNETKTELSQD